MVMQTIRAVANEYGVHRATVVRWITSGIHGQKLNAQKVGGNWRVSPDAAADFFARCTEKATGENIPAVESPGDVAKRIEAARKAIRRMSNN